MIFAGLVAAGVSAQVRPVYDRGATGLEQTLKQLNTSASVMMIGAHPDDEDTALLAYLARGEHARTAYLSLTRGDGGQNIIGSELGESLGVIRTEELLQARRLDGAEQFFTRAYDYGFSKTLAEARSKWDEKVILCDAVKAIREFRPLVVVSQFSGTPADGHGQHQYAGYITPLAVKAAGDATQCRGSGEVWKVERLYTRQGFRASGEADLKINTGTFDSFLGRSYFEIAMEARSQHKSQGQGSLELRGDVFSGLNNSGQAVKDIFEGVDTSFASSVAKENGDQAMVKAATEIQTQLAAINAKYDTGKPAEILSALATVYKKIADAEDNSKTDLLKTIFRDKREQVVRAIRLAAGIQIDALSDKETVVSGEEFGLAVRVFYPNSGSLTVKSVSVDHPAGWGVASVENIAAEPQGFYRRENAKDSRNFTVTVSKNEPLTQPYWLKSERSTDLYDWSGADNFATLPFSKPTAFGKVEIEIAGVPIELLQPIEYRYADDVRGEVRRDLNIVPRVTAAADETMKIVKRSDGKQQVKTNITVTNNSAAPVSGILNLDLPAGWTAVPKDLQYKIEKPGATQTFDVAIEIPNGISDGTFTTRITEKQKVVPSVETIEYPHIQTHRIYRPAEIEFVVLDVRSTDRKIGYIPGSGDTVAEAAEKIGFNVSVIGKKEIDDGDLSKYDTVLLGIRASETVADFKSLNAKLLDWVRGGGTLVVQYQRPSYAQNFTPFPATLGPRVTDENAKITILQPNDPIFNVPNKITGKDFEGWVQERNLYNFSEAGKNYIGLLESHDVDEPENGGGLVTANVGKGKYVYCSYSLFRQLPAGVPGAYRLLANLLSY